jgi:transcriptional regulator with XRE-family HTH domain
MSDVAHNVHRLMARSGLTLKQVVACSGLCERTVKGILSGRNKPHARTLHRLAAGLRVSTDELFQKPSLLTHRSFDRRTNPAVDTVVSSHPEWFDQWRACDFDELYSHFGTGGALTEDGAAQVVLSMNRKREVHQKVDLLLESAEAELLTALVNLLYQRIVLSPE